MSIAIRFETGTAPTPDTVRFRWNGRYGLLLGTCGDSWLMASALDGTFVIDVARRTIRCFADDFDRSDWQDVFVRRVLPRAAMLFGAIALHAAAVAIDGRGLMLAGPSGAGKSTLSAALADAGWDILSDDIAILQASAAPRLAPATTGVCVWDDSRAALGLAPEHCAPMPGYEGKVRFVSGNDRGIAPVPLKGLVFLDRSPDHVAPALHPLPAGEGLVRAAQQRIRFDPSDTTSGESAAAFRRLAAILRSTPCYRLAYPARYDALTEVEAMLRQLLAK